MEKDSPLDSSNTESGSENAQFKLLTCTFHQVTLKD